MDIGLAELIAQRDAALKALDAAVVEQDRLSTEATMWDADSPASASMRGRAGGIYYASDLVKSAFGIDGR